MESYEHKLRAGLTPMGLNSFDASVSSDPLDEIVANTQLYSFINRENRVPHYQRLFQEGGKQHVRQWNQVRANA
jgi:hypothetical protein